MAHKCLFHYIINNLLLISLSKWFSLLRPLTLQLIPFLPLTINSFFFFLLATSAGWHMADHRLGVKSELQLRTTPQAQQHQIQATSVTYAAASGNVRSLTHWVTPGIKCTSSRTLCQVLNLLSHNGNSKSFLLMHTLFLLQGSISQPLEKVTIWTEIE